MLHRFEPMQYVPTPQLSWSNNFQSVPIIIDNGAFECRAGYASQPEPHVTFRNLIYRPRSSKSVLVGNDISVPDAVAYLLKSAFLEGSGLLTGMDVQEQVFDHIFDRLSVQNGGGCVDHPVVFNEMLCNPHVCRTQLSELLFETYGIPKLSYYVDSLASYYESCSQMDRDTRAFNEQSDCLLVSLGHHTTHLIPLYRNANGFTKPVWSAVRRLNIGGAHINWLISRLLQLKYPCHMERISFGLAEYLVQELGKISLNYREEMSFWKSPIYRDGHTVKIQLPFVQSAADELNAAYDRRRAQFLRMREMHRRRQFDQGDEDDGDTPKELVVQQTETTQSIKNSSKTICYNSLHPPGSSAITSLFPDVDSVRTPSIELVGRHKRAAEFLVSLALPAAVQAQLIANPISDNKITDSKLKHRIRMATQLELKRDDNFLKWLLFIRHSRMKVSKKRTLRQSKIDLATELGLYSTPADNATSASNQTSDPVGSTGATNSTFASSQKNSGSNSNLPKTEVYRTDMTNAGSGKGVMTERRRLQLEKINAIAAELKSKRVDFTDSTNKKRKLPSSPKPTTTTTPGKSPKKSEKPKSTKPMKLKQNSNSKQSKQQQQPNCEPENVIDTLTDDMTESLSKEIDELDEQEMIIPTPSPWDIENEESNGGTSPQSTTDPLPRPTKPEIGNVEQLSNESEDERDELAVFDCLLALYDPETHKELGAQDLKVEVDEFYTLHLSTEVTRSCEVLFQPSFIGHTVSGLGDCLDFVLRDTSKFLNTQSYKRDWPRRIFLTGGLAQLPGLSERIYSEIRPLLNYGPKYDNIDICVAAHPQLNAWYGARRFALNEIVNIYTSRQMYEECGSHYLMSHNLGNDSG